MSEVDNPSSIARVTEIIASSPSSFEDAIDNGLRRAAETLDNIEGVWISSQKLELRDGEILAYRVGMKLTFALTT